MHNSTVGLIAESGVGRGGAKQHEGCERRSHQQQVRVFFTSILASIQMRSIRLGLDRGSEKMEVITSERDKEK